MAKKNVAVELAELEAQRVNAQELQQQITREQLGLPAPEYRHHVYVAINQVTKALAQIGISKTHKNTQGWMYRGIDDIYRELAPLLAEYSLCIIPHATGREIVERLSKKGEALFYVTVAVEYHIVSAIDGSRHIARVFGEAMDSSDKATNKALSAAYKYLCLQTFCIPTEGDNDADASHYDVEPRLDPRLEEALRKTKEAFDQLREKLSSEYAIEHDVILADNYENRLFSVYKDFRVLFAEVKKSPRMYYDSAINLSLDRIMQVLSSLGHPEALAMQQFFFDQFSQLKPAEDPLYDAEHEKKQQQAD